MNNNQSKPPSRIPLEIGGLSSARVPLFAGHSLASAAREPKITPVGVSPLLARLQAFLPALKAANEQTAPRTTIDEVVNSGNDNDSYQEEPGSNEAGALESSSSSSSRGVSTGSDPADENKSPVVTMDVVLVPEGSGNEQAEAMVDSLAVDAAPAPPAVGVDAAGAESPLTVSLELETGAPAPLHPVIRIVEP